MAALNLPFAVVNLDGFLETYRFHASRGTNFESVWYAVGHLGREWRVPWMDALSGKPLLDVVSTGPFVAALLFSGWAAWTRRLDPVAAAAVPVLAFLVFNKVFSVQYVLWALPLILLTGRTTLQKALVVVADLAVFTTLFMYFAVSGHYNSAALFFPVAMAVLLRAAAFAWCLLSLVQDARRPASPVPAPPLDVVVPPPPARTGAPARGRDPLG
jgi:hypothetical protein